MKKISGVLCLALLSGLGCLDMHTGHLYTGSSGSKAEKKVAETPQPSPKPVTPDQITPSNARKTADALWQELDRSDKVEP
jgi:hypothetical protein